MTDAPLPDADALLQEQIAYYRARAPEYDAWWLRTGRYEPDDAFGRRWEAGKRQMHEALVSFAPTGSVLEIAAGTGNLTVELAAMPGVKRITAIDASKEALTVARPKLPIGMPITLEAADVFAWQPTEQFDVVAFGFWLSHVPPARFQSFWDLVGRALRPSGRVFFVDNAVPIEQAASADGRVTSTPWSQTWLDAAVSVRTLSDGRQFHIVKRAWTPDDLERELREVGWNATVHSHEDLFISGWALPIGGA